jgi:hypothetical protein
VFKGVKSPTVNGTNPVSGPRKSAVYSNIGSGMAEEDYPADFDHMPTEINAENLVDRSLTVHKINKVQNNSPIR